MIQGHTIDALLAPAFRLGPLFQAWSFTRGLTSTAFLFAAGFAFSLVTADAARATSGRKRRVRRGAQLVFLGYLLHAPVSALFGVPWARALQEAQIVDVLQCIGVSLWLLELVDRFVPGDALKLALSALLAAACFLLSSASQRVVPEGMLSPLLHYVTARGGSLFPLIPWSGYVLGGYGLGVLLRRYRARAPRATSKVLAVAAWALLCCAGLLATSSRLPKDTAFLVLKLGLVVLVSSSFAWALAGRKRLPGWLERLSGETLFLYVSHVLLLYATGVGLQTLVGRSLTPWWAAVLALLFMLACSASALLYRRTFEALRRPRGGGRPALQRIGSRGETENHIS